MKIIIVKHNSVLTKKKKKIAHPPIIIQLFNSRKQHKNSLIITKESYDLWKQLRYKNIIVHVNVMHIPIYSSRLYI